MKDALGPSTAHSEAFGIPEAAAAAGFSRAFFYKLLAEGRGPKILKLGKRTLVRRQALSDWLERLEAETPQPFRANPEAAGEPRP